MKILLSVIPIFMFLVASVVTAQNGSRTNKQMQSVAEQFDFVKKLMQQYPDGNFDHRIRYLGRDVLLIESNKKLYRNGSPTEASTKRHLEIMIDSYNDECKRDSKSNFCKAVTENLAVYKDRYGSEYTPQDITYPQINLDDHSYTLADGSTVNLKSKSTSRAVTTSATTTVSTPITVSTAVTASPTASVSTTTTVSTTAAASGTATGQDVSCEWQPGTNRRILTGEGCETKICSGMVICTKNSRKIKRLATCSSELCGEGQATACHKQLGYGSARANLESSSPASSPRDKAKPEGSTR